MSDRHGLAGALAVFDSPDDVVEAVRSARARGFRRLDVVSPYPLHGIDELLGKAPSRLGYVALAAGLLAAIAAKTIQWWTSAVDYPLNVGGKPLFSWPAFVPVTFEVMVLVTSVTTVFTMLVVMNRLPWYGSALGASRFMPDLTRDRFGLVVDARDPLFDPATVKDDLAGQGRVGFELLQWRRERMPQRVFSPWFAVFLAAAALASATATRMVMAYGGAAPFDDFMKDQPRLDPQRASGDFADGLGMRLPAAGTVARGEPLVTSLTPEQSAALADPVPLTAASIERGRTRFAIYCQPCHGLRGQGDGTLTSAFPKAPSLHGAKVREWQDGRILYVMDHGQNLMPSYASQVALEDRWDVIHFIRALQRSLNAPDGDFQ
jgi:mono/diheme cytochrome c family protein